MSANLPSNSKYEQHMLGCADIAAKVAEKLGLRDNGAVQACFATICIDAQKHGVFMEPTPRNGKTPVPPTEAPPVTPQRATPPKGEVVGENVGAIRDPTPEQAESGKRTALLDGIQKAVKVLNTNGYTPPLTPKSLNALIKSDMKIEGGLGALDVEQLEFLMKKLSTTLDTLQHNKKALDNDIPF